MWIWLKKPPQEETHPLYWICYCFIGTEDGWIEYDNLDFGLCTEILKRMGYIKWQKLKK